MAEMKRILIGIAILVTSAVSSAQEQTADAVLSEVKGEVKVGQTQVSKGSAIPVSARISTGNGALAVIHFRDGQMVALMENSSIQLKSYQYDAADPVASRLAFDLLSGGMRYSSETAASQPANRVLVASDMASMTTAGGDFIALKGSLYVSVAKGLVTISNDAGSLTFTAGQTAYVGSVVALPTGINAAQIPQALNQAFAQLGTIESPFSLPKKVAKGGGGASGGATTGSGLGLGGGVSGTAVAVGAGVAALLGVVAAGDGGSSTTTHHTAN
ncbi:MAG TPA: hypothetical protein ENK54_06325 [Thiotrichales bacterium]|nr:hypothetical protein [Thiotrichales bacterium]